MREIDVRQLEYFVAVAEELNFTRAALRCRVAQSALSHQVARLERRHGVVLFERTSRAVRLAAAGELLLPRARRILAEVYEATAALAAFGVDPEAATAERTVRVAAALAALGVLTLAAHQNDLTVAWRPHMVVACFDALGHRRPVPTPEA